MLTAQEARELTFNNIENGETKQLKEIMDLINKAIKEGKYSINGIGILQNNTFEKIEELGYKIKETHSIIEHYWYISWE